MAQPELGVRVLLVARGPVLEVIHMLNRARLLFPFLFCWLALASAALAGPPPPSLAGPPPSSLANPPPAAGAPARPPKPPGPAPDPLAVHLQRADAARRAARWADAERAYRAVWEIQRRPDIAGELGACELALGRHRDAAEHLQLSLEQPDLLPPDQRRRFQDALLYVQERVASFVIRAEPSNAEVFLDGRPIGPPRDTYFVFVDPGSHTVSATLAGHGEVSVRTEVSAGVMSSVGLVVPRRKPAPLPLAPAPASAPVPAPCPSAAGCRRTTLEALRYAGFFATGAGAALGLGLVVAADAVHREAQHRGTGLAPSACHTNPDLPVCNDLRQMIETRDLLAGTGVVTLLVTAAVGGATVASLWWEPSPEPPSTGLRVLPATARDQLGVVLDGRW